LYHLFVLFVLVGVVVDTNPQADQVAAAVVALHLEMIYQ
tara:strand:+ start:111 stop:227 length:117 start_codon:yes stop_codon:yes gene_type:complete